MVDVDTESFFSFEITASRGFRVLARITRVVFVKRLPWNVSSNNCISFFNFSNGVTMYCSAVSRAHRQVPLTRDVFLSNNTDEFDQCRRSISTT